MSTDQVWPAQPPAIDEHEWVEFLLGARPIEGLQPPPLPDAAVQERFVGSSGPEAFKEAITFCAKLRATADAYSGGLHADSRVLDFGVGWGRLYRVMLDRVSPAGLVGVDVHPMCVEMCRQAMPYGTFFADAPEPPLGCAAESFDIVYAYSVFSHLAPQVTRAWLCDFHRILRPGGLVLFTTLKAAHLDVWRRQAAEEGTNYARCLRLAGFDYKDWRRRGDRGEVLYLPIGGGDGLDASFYGEAIITKQALKELARATDFAVRTFDDGGDLPQTFVVLQRP